MTRPTPGAPDVVATPDVARSIRKEIARLRRRLTAIARDIARSTEGRELQHRAELLVHSKLPNRGATEVAVIDYGTDPPQRIVVALDSALAPREQVEGWFRTARRYQRGAELGHERAAATRTAIAWFEQVLAVMEQPDASEADVAALLADARLAKFSRAAAPRDRHDRVVSKRLPFREFVGDGGAHILVGRGARDNDQLTTRVARPQDVFLHVQGATGAHVIIPRAKGEQLPAALLLDGALLAHHFSSVAADGRSDVSYTERRYVQKRRGAPVGTVQLLREKVVHLVVAPERLAQLVAAEVRGA